MDVTITPATESRAAIIAKINDLAAAYQSADKSDKAKIRKSLDDIMRTNLSAGEFMIAQAAHEALAGLVSKSPEKVEIDYSQVLADRIATLRYAADCLESGSLVPTGWDDVTIDRSTLPRGTVDVEAADKIATAKITKSGDRHSIDDVVARAIEGKSAGTFMKVSEVRLAGAIDGYSPSDGAIAARLFPKSGDCTLTGVIPAEATADRPVRGLIVA